jgi:C1A family cysteine protease
MRNHKNLKGIMALVISVMMITGTVPLSTTALQETKNSTVKISGVEEIKGQSSNKDPFAFEEGYTTKSRKNKPSSFDLRHVDEGGTDTSYITPVKVQNPYGTCWGFGAIAAAESSILSSKLAEGYDANTLDLSEKQIAWFAMNPISDKNNSQYGEGANFKDGATAVDKYNAGGGTLFATGLFASGIGPVKENTNTDDGNIFAYRGKNGEVNSEKVTWIDDEGQEQTGIRRTSYSDEDDWEIPEEYRFCRDYQLRESYLLPNPVDFYDEYHPEATEAIKEQLLQKRAVSISIQASHSVAGEDTSATEDTIMSANWAQYSDMPFQNHVVTIVGYDDNYPKSNFIKNHQPPEDGAWLVKNSWGSDLNDFPNNGYAHWGLLEGQDIVGSSYTATSQKHTGYFWLSYYDASISGPEAYVFEKNDDSIIYNQYDYMTVAEYGEYATDAENKMSNVFTAKENEQLKEVAFLTATPGTKITYSVYLLSETAKNPEDGICVYESGEIEYNFGGYHREVINPENPIYICKGQKYAVVVTEKTPSGKYSLSFGKNDIEPRHNSDSRCFKSVINKGESYLFIDGKWMDMSDDAVQNMLLADEYGLVWNTCADNFPIKAFTTKANTGGAYLVVTNRNKYTVSDIELKKTTEMPLLAQFKGAKDELDDYNPAISWESSDPEILSVTKDGDNDFKVTIKALKPGTVYLKVDAGKYGTKIIDVTVRKFAVTNAEFDEDANIFTYSGKAIKPKLYSVSAETEDEFESTYDLEEGKDYIIKYKNNTLCGRAKAVVQGIGEYGGVVENNDTFNNLSFIIIPAKAQITSVTPGKNKMTVKFKSQKATGISGYVLYYKVKGSKTVKTKKLSKSATSATITGLTQGKKYQVYLKAYVRTYDADAVYNEEYDYYEPGYANHFGKASSIKSVLIPVNVPKLKSVKGYKKSVKATFASVKGVSGYQIKYSLKKSMKNSKIKTVKGASKTKITVKKLKAQKRYYIRIRAYKVVNGKRVYSKWSAKKSAKTK